MLVRLARSHAHDSRPFSTVHKLGEADVIPERLNVGRHMRSLDELTSDSDFA